MTKVKNMAKYSAMITIVLILSKTVGVLRDILIAGYFGATRITDMYTTATNIPQLFYGCIGAALTVSFIPVFSNVKKDKEKANMFFNNILNIVFLICLALTLVGTLFSTQLTELMASGFTPEQIAKTSFLTKIVMPSIIFFAINGLYTGYLQSYDIFLQPAFTSIVANMAIIVGVVIFYKYGVVAAIIAYLIGSIIQLFIQRPFMKEYKYKPYINFKDTNIRKMLILSVPIIISTAVGRINVMVANNYASTLPAGSVAIVSYATRLTSLINQVFIVSITTVFYPKLTEKFTENATEEFNALIVKALNIIVIIVIPLVLGLFILSEPVVKLVFEHGKFTSEATRVTSQCLRYLVFSAIGYSFMDILGKVFFSSKDTLTPMINGFIQIGLNILLVIILTPIYGINGLVTATTISVSVVAIIMFIELNIKLKGINYNKSIITFLKSLISSVIMAAVVYVAYKYLNIIFIKNSVAFLALKICLSTFVGIISYALLLKLLKVKELSEVLPIRSIRTKNK
ncbi:putative peptidoglycan biosynthesis protein MurJ [Clostridium tepidiprofundi DSM 19306]|uniref:Probable lipid II flippase MurJ n=1 Tax=Clostridium tepidiprofundi DSM 19306 TaxID=1121338 RepID=A0A151B5F4_9CLOT|nr:murein biosynthesis integral membrane protein MurJ [Clostridium tepidiprofundi]KYH35135.1 putative peptidoglycan biosynthesis protein MurJ [Clostridium tepidiprofundi DSM 19306]